MNMVGVTIFFVAILEIGKKIPLSSYVHTPQSTDGSSLLHFLSTTMGANLLEPTLFSVGLGPYMTALILWSALSLLANDRIQNLSEKERGLILRALTFLFSVLQAIILTREFRPLMLDASLSQELLSILILSTGGVIIAWLVDMNLKFGLGMQMVFYLPGIVQGILSMLITGETVMPQTSHFSLPRTLGIFLFSLLFLFLTGFFYQAERRIPVQQTSVTSSLSDAYIPIRLLNAGVMPFMFTSSLFQLPQVFFQKDSDIAQFFSLTHVTGIVIYGLLFFVLSMGFSYVAVRPHELAKTLKESGDYLINTFPGQATAQLLSRIMVRLAVVGNGYLVVMSVSPLFVGLFIPAVQRLSFYTGTLFFLLVISDTLVQSFRFVRERTHYTLFED
jgi:preprotein translocase subunit SecY